METSRRILVVDDQESVRRGLTRILSELGHLVEVAPDAESAILQADETPPDLVIIDLNLPGRSGLDLVADLQERGTEATLVVLTGNGSIDSAIEATRRGVFDYLLKPIEPSRLLAVIERGLERASLRQEVQHLRREMMRTGKLRQLVGRSPRMLELFRLMDQVAPSDASVLITGESGTGKEVVARSLHGLSPRSARAFVAINCAAIPATLLESEILGHEKGAFTGATSSRAGCFEQAGDGTLFLDEIVEMPVDLQSKLLRVLEDGKVRRVGGNREISVDIRVVAATNADVARLIEDGKLRPDLYYRLNVFLEEFRPECRSPIAGFSTAALDLLLRHPWPGNVRELRNAIRQAVILCPGGEIQPENLPSSLREPLVSGISRDGRQVIIPIGASAAEAEKALILATLRACEGDKPRAAGILGLSLKTLYTRLKNYRVETAPPA